MKYNGNFGLHVAGLAEPKYKWTIIM